MLLTTIKKCGVAFIIVVFAASCKKNFLELQNPTALSPDQSLSSESDLQVALRGAYSGMRSANNQARTIPVFGDILADNGYISVANSNRYTYANTLTWTTANTDMLNFWTTSYNVILRANNIINSSLSGGNIDQYKGEAYAIRALNYFTLVRYWARPYTDNPKGPGVPIVTDYNPFYYPPRGTVEDVYKLIIDDLNKAYTMMTKFTNSSQFSKYAAKALLAKVYLTMGDKANAKTAALDVINNSGFTLVSAAGYKAYWDNAAVRTDKVETLFEISSDATNNAGFDDLSGIYSQNGGYGDILASDDLYALFEASDVRKTLYSTGTRGGLPSVFVNKYPNNSGDRSDTKIVRLSEMYLIVAEASVETNVADVLTYVNAITSRRNASPIVSNPNLMDDIIKERRKELAFEGDRFLDMNRLKLDINRSANYPASARSIPYSSFRRLLPIPQTELDANANIRSQQNPGY
jgi:hypothetical protein